MISDDARRNRVKVRSIFSAIYYVMALSCTERQLENELEPTQIVTVDSNCIKTIDSLKVVIQDRESEIMLMRNGGVKADEYWDDSLNPPYNPDKTDSVSK